MKQIKIAPKYVLLKWFISASTICAPCQGAMGQESESRAAIQERTSTSCKAGPLKLHAVNYIVAPEDDAIIDALISEDNKGNVFRSELCNDYDEKYINQKYQSIILDRLKVANLCEDSIVREAEDRNWGAELAFIKEQNIVSSEIEEIIVYAELTNRFASSSSEAFEKLYSGVSNATGLVSGIKEAQLVVLGGKTFRKFVIKQLEDAHTDQTEDLIVDQGKPWNAVGYTISAVTDRMFRERLSEITSFSHSRCQ